jgi:spermidine/putrescine-binding protein
MTVNRRHFLLGLAGSALLAGCGRSTETLRIFVYAGGHEKTMRELFVPKFEEMTNTRVILDAGWWDAIAKLKTSPVGKPAYDLLITDATQGYVAANEGLFAPIDFSLIPNHKNLSPSALENRAFKEGFGLPYPDSVMTLAYRLAPGALGAHEARVPHTPTSWKWLTDQALSGRVALYSSFYMSLYTFACMLVAVEGKPGTAQDRIRNDLAGVFRFARENRQRVKFWWPTSTDMILALANNDCAAGNMHSPEMLQALKDRPDLAAVVPPDDRAFVQVMWCIAQGTPRRTLAHQAIDLLFSDEMQLAFARRGSASAVLSVAQKMAAEDEQWKSIYPHTQEQLASLRYYPYDFYAEHWDDIADEWERTILKGGPRS